MYPNQGHRVISTNTDIIFEKKHQTNYTRVCLPGLDKGTVSYIRKFCNFYKCNFSKKTFNNQVKIYKSEANDLFKANFNQTIKNKAYLHRKISLCNIGIHEDWHSPVFVIKINSNIIATTGHNKIYATSLRKQNYNMDFECFVMDFDNDPEDYFININEITTDAEFSNGVGSDQFAIDISVERTIGGFVPSIMQFSKEYPIKYHDGSHTLADNNYDFFNKLSVNNTITIKIQDTYNSRIIDSSGIFNIVQNNTNASMSFKTKTQIHFDLSDLLPFFTSNATHYADERNTYSAYVIGQPIIKKISCPSESL
jgi:hypothetical protein